MLGDSSPYECSLSSVPNTGCDSQSWKVSLMSSVVGVFIRSSYCLIVYVHVLFPLPRLLPDIDREM